MLYFRISFALYHVVFWCDIPTKVKRFENRYFISIKIPFKYHVQFRILLYTENTEKSKIK